MPSWESYVAAAIAELDKREVVRRIWDRDHSVWDSDPTEISDRLGWLTVAGQMRQQVAGLRAFAEEIRNEGYEQVVLLGMGGSSLGALALEMLLGRANGYPKLVVLDSTVPDMVASVEAASRDAKTLYIIASKSGTTIEPNMLYRYFRALVEQSVGTENAGRDFVAICDAGTELEHMAREQGFRETFINPADIGGRYSVQSLFGLVPASLTGIDIEAFLSQVEIMRGKCAATVAVEENPGAWLGAAIVELYKQGCDKLTLVTTESLAGFGLWVEQLLAESTGKEGRGIIPIIGEPRLAADVLGNDRFCVYVRLDGDNADETDAYVDDIEASGVPTIILSLSDKYEIGAEFFRWEFATAVAGSLMGIHPFDQPDVQRAKDNTARLLEGYQSGGVRPSLNPVGSLADLIGQVKPGCYLSITAYVEPTPQFEQAIAVLRARISNRSYIPTTFAYGPRYLHSTGQLHKGGTDSGLFLQLVQTGDSDVTIPGEAFTFGVLAAAQAKGDLDALSALGRPVARISLYQDAGRTIYDLANGLH